MTILKSQISIERKREKNYFHDNAKTIIGLFMLVLLATQDIQLGHATPKKPHSDLADVVYVVSNDPVKSGNAILGYRRDQSGNLVPLPGSPFLTGGKGYATKEKEFGLPHFGPFDLDQNIIVNNEQTRLFATNGGSDTIAVFDIQPDGGLIAVKGSPFPSGGKNPVSLALAGNKLYVVNKNEDPLRDMTQTKPNYTGFRVSNDGRLTPIPNSTIELTPASRSPTQALLVRDKFIFDGDFGRFPLASRVAMWGEEIKRDTPSMIRSFKINHNGTLTQHAPIPAPSGAFEGGLDVDDDGESDPLMFGLQAHPKEPLIYVSMVSSARLAVFKYDNDGKLSFVRLVPNKGQLICWIKINKEGTRAYTTNNGDNTVSVYDLADPTNPIEIQTLKLKGDGHPYQMDLDSSEEFLHIVKHRTFPETPIGKGSELNVLKIKLDGTLEEVASSPEVLPVRDDLLARPQGVVAL
ncbi:hypothetical protein [Nitrosomonas sp.]|uniref:lactonase family protein n=1 Tax=Nitrosomonas sp. TaxID=42353 RepID=UPI00208ADFA6|nr:hypothetical protein [Nitrosomonas sp.]GJL75232.1 MAG: hypothetical protein NMNS02_13380 [Nitrosomonas sp.]